MGTELEKHLQQGADALVHAAVDGSIRKIPLSEVKQIIHLLVKNEVITPWVGAGVLAVDARVITEAGRKDTAMSGKSN